jgi:hypothetical protein
MKYTTFEKLERKLRGRLKIVEISENPLYPSTSLQQEVDPDLVEDVIEEQENLLDLILEQIYILPLKNNHPILTDIVNNLVMAEIIKVHFQGQGLANIGSDLSGLARDTKMEAYNKLAMLTVGYQVFIPNQQMIVKPQGMTEYRKIVLQGESLRIAPPEKVPINNETILLDRSVILSEKYNPFSDNYQDENYGY